MSMQIGQKQVQKVNANNQTEVTTQTNGTSPSPMDDVQDQSNIQTGNAKSESPSWNKDSGSVNQSKWSRGWNAFKTGLKEFGRGFCGHAAYRATYHRIAGHHIDRHGPMLVRYQPNLDGRIEHLQERSLEQAKAADTLRFVGSLVGAPLALAGFIKGLLEGLAAGPSSQVESKQFLADQFPAEKVDAEQVKQLYHENISNLAQYLVAKHGDDLRQCERAAESGTEADRLMEKGAVDDPKPMQIHRAFRLFTSHFSTGVDPKADLTLALKQLIERDGNELVESANDRPRDFSPIANQINKLNAKRIAEREKLIEGTDKLIGFLNGDTDDPEPKSHGLEGPFKTGNPNTAAEEDEPDSTSQALRELGLAT